MPDVPTDAPLSMLDNETYTNAITTVVGEARLRLDAQARNVLRQAFTASTRYEADHARGLSSDGPREPDFDQWIEEYIEDHERITSE
jgi:hypothetical protein